MKLYNFLVYFIECALHVICTAQVGDGGIMGVHLTKSVLALTKLYKNICKRIWPFFFQVVERKEKKMSTESKQQIDTSHYTNYCGSFFMWDLTLKT